MSKDSSVLFIYLFFFLKKVNKGQLEIGLKLVSSLQHWAKNML